MKISYTMSFENLTRNQKVRAALHRDVRLLCSETCHLLGLDITKQAMDIISELVYRKITVYGTDLEAFAKHAKRSSINSEDVKLLVRRNPSLKAHLNAIAPPSSAVKDKRRKTVLPVIKPPETPIKPTEEPRKEDKTRPETVKEPELVKQTESVKQLDIVIQPEELDNAMAVDDTIDLTFD